MPRARAVIVQDGAGALIERHRDGRHYLVVPGGGPEPGEAAREVAAREVWDELGPRVEAGALPAEVPFKHDSQQFFAATIDGGTLGGGHGRELTGPADPASGTYRPVWVPIADLPRLPVLPESIAGVIVTWAKHGGARAGVEPERE